jgi:hypothetical protein
MRLWMDCLMYLKMNTSCDFLSNWDSRNFLDGHSMCLYIDAYVYLDGQSMCLYIDGFLRSH